MDYTKFLPRRLSHHGCIVAGTKLKTHYDDVKKTLKDAKAKLAPKVDTAVNEVIRQTNVLESIPVGDATMVEIDRGADRCIAGLDNQLEAIQQCFAHGTVLQLTDDENARLADATLVRGALLPEGTSFIRQIYSAQWRRMSAMLAVIDTEEVVAAVQRLGLSSEIARFRRWVELYGDKLGVTERKRADPAAAALEAWHVAYGQVFTHVGSEYDDEGDALQLKIHDALLTPYSDQIDEERREDQKARAKRKAKEQ